ncbi:MAG: hypothetical protein A4E51_01794 [Methanosaeta sp. PtaU1.Bin055]|nr:MAG: hypothetical protein A4E51_01794 [Methanosaeta sp. PtaU1.Bin055]
MRFTPPEPSASLIRKSNSLPTIFLMKRAAAFPSSSGWKRIFARGRSPVSPTTGRGATGQYPRTLEPSAPSKIPAKKRLQKSRTPGWDR